MARVLSGVVVKENRDVLGILVAGSPEAVRGSPELRRTSRLGFVSFKRGGASGIDDGFALRLRTVTDEPIPAVSQPVGRVLRLRAQPRLSRALTSGNPYFAAE